MKNKPTRIVIADTSALISFLSPNDSNHHEAMDIAQQLDPSQVEVITPADVFSETLDTLNKKVSHPTALRAGALLTDSGQFLIVDCFDLYQLAMEKFRSAEGSASFTDCVVMATADRYQTKEIFGFDKCFSDCGYHLPKQE